MITIINQIPSNKFLPSANPINVSVDSDANGKCNFRYVCDILIDGDNVFRFKLFPDPLTGYGFFQLADVISDYLNEYLPQNNTAAITVGTSTEAKSVVQVDLQFGEEYDNSTDCTGDVITRPNLAQSNTFYVYLGALDYEEWPSYNDAKYKVDYSTTFTQAGPYFLTKRPRGSVEVSYGDSYYLDWLSLVPPVSGVTQLTIFTSLGGTILFNAPTLTSVKKYRVACGPHDINRALNMPAIHAGIKWYDVLLRSGSSTNYRTETFRIWVKAPGAFRTRIGFIGSLGSVEYETFFHRNRAAYEIQRKDYKKYLTTNKGGGNWSYDVGDRQATTYATTATERHLVSTFVDEATSSWLWEMWLSTNVWVEDRPTQMPFRVFREDSTPTSRMLYWLEDNHGLVVGDSFFSIPKDIPQYGDYRKRFTIVGVSGNIVDVGVTFDTYNITNEACGWLVKDEESRRIPIVISDQSVEVKQKTGKQIEYQLQYKNSVDKFTLRG